MCGPRRRSSVWSTPMTIGPAETKAATTARSSVRASARPDQALRLSTRWKAAKPGCQARPCQARPSARRQFVTVRGPTASSAPTARAAAVGRLRRERTARYGPSQARKPGGRWSAGRAMADLLGYGGTASLNSSRPGRTAMAAGDRVLEQIAAYPWPRGGVQARRIRGGYTPDLDPHGGAHGPAEVASVRR